MPPRKLSTKIFLGVFLGTAIILFAVSLFAFLSVKAVLQRAIMDFQLQMVRQSMNQIDRLLYERSADIQAIAGENLLQHFLANAASHSESERADIFRRITDLTILTGPWDILIIADKQGRVALSSESIKGGKSIKENTDHARAFETVMREELYFSDMILSQDTNRPTVIFAAPVRDSKALNHPVIGAVIGYFSWPAVLQILEDIPGSAALFNREGTLIGQNLEFAEANPFLKRVADHALGQSLKDRRSVSVIHFKKDDVLREEVLASLGTQSGYLSYHGSGWGLVMERPARIAFEPATWTAFTLVLFLIPLIILASIPIFVMLFKWVSWPVAVLTQTTREIAAGNWDKRVPVMSRDEMGELAVSFNTMTEKLREMRDHLEQQVRERTEKLLKANEALKISERKIHLIIETANDAFISIDAQGKVTDWNQEAEKIFGWTHREAVAKALAELIIPQQHRAAHRRGLEKYFQTGEGPVLNKRIEITALHRDGHEFLIELTIWPVRAGSDISFNAFIRDIAERKKAESELGSSRARFQNILDTASDTIISIDEDRKIILFNKQAQMTFGYKTEEVLGKPLDLLMPERFRGRHGMHVKGFAASDIAFQLMSQRSELLGLRKNGEEFPVEITISKVEMEGKFIFTAILRDVTEQKRLEGMVLQAEKIAAIGQLAAGVAHEINNPLGVILGFAQGMAKRTPPGDPSEMPLKSIEREAVRCKRLVQDLLTFSRTDKTQKEEMDLHEAIEGALSLVEVQTKMKKVELVRRFDNGLPRISVNNSQIQQIVINLCNNSMDAMPNGGRITVQTQKEILEGKEYLQISVEDTGEGIRPEIRSKIFDPFFTTKEVGKGTGMGLSLVYGIVEKHEGKINFDSEVGAGTLFRVFLPLNSNR